MDVEKILSTAEAGGSEKRDLRMRRRIDRRSANPIPVPVLSLRDHFSDLRRGSDFSRAVRGRVHRFADRRVHRDSRVPAFVDRRTGLGVGQRVFKLGQVK